MLRSTIRSAAVLAFIALAAASAAAAGAAPPAAPSLGADQLLYEGATVDVQIDVNGEAAAQFLGSILDAAAETAEEQVAAMEQRTVPHQVVMARPLIGPAKEVVKSITQVTLLVMKTEETLRAEDIMSHYRDLITPRGWTPMATIRTGDGVNIAAYLAPEGKGLLGAIRPGARELIVGLITSREPLGDLLAHVVRAGGSEIVPQIFAAHAMHGAPAPDAGCQEAEPAADETPPVE